MTEPLIATGDGAIPAPTQLGTALTLVAATASATQDTSVVIGKIGVLLVYSPTEEFRIVFDNVTPTADDPATGMLFEANKTHRFLTRPETRYFRIYTTLATVLHWESEIIQGTPIP